MAHTPGPWSAHPGGDNEYIISAGDHASFDVSVKSLNARADADLIVGAFALRAAHDELLDACKVLVAEDYTVPKWQAARAKVREFIAARRVTGE